MRELVFINSLAETFTPTASGAIATWLWEVCQAARRDGCEPFVISKESHASPYPWSRLHLLPYPTPPGWKGGGRWQILQQRLAGWGHVREKAFAVKVADALRSLQMERALLMLHNDVELAVYLREQFPQAVVIHHFHKYMNPADSRFRRRFRRSVDVATGVSGFCARWNAEYYGVPVHTVFNGVDTDLFKPAVDAASSRVRINFVGRTDAAKGPDLLLESALKLALSRTDFEVQLLGTNHYGYSQADPYEERLRHSLDRLRSAGVVAEWPGWVPRAELPGRLQTCHINVVPSRWDEPFGLTTLEGMSAGLATIASRTGGTPEVVEQAGLLFERGDVAQLAAHLEMLMSSPRTLADWRRKARRRALQLTWDHTWSSLRALLEERGFTSASAATPPQ